MSSYLPTHLPAPGWSAVAQAKSWSWTRLSKAREHTAQEQPRLARHARELFQVVHQSCLLHAGKFIYLPAPSTRHRRALSWAQQRTKLVAANAEQAHAHKLVACPPKLLVDRPLQRYAVCAAAHYEDVDRILFCAGFDNLLRCHTARVYAPLADARWDSSSLFQNPHAAVQEVQA